MTNINFDEASEGEVISASPALRIRNKGTGIGLGVFGDNNIAIECQSENTGLHGMGGKYGVHGESPKGGTAVWGENKGSGYGVLGTVSFSKDNNDGVHGQGRNGVHGKSAGKTGNGVWGEHSGSGYGVLGTSSGSDGVYGQGKNGVHGQSSDKSGVWGENKGSGYGVLGTSNLDGVYGIGDEKGVRGESKGEGEGSDGVYGLGRNGVHGKSAGKTGNGVWGENKGSGYGVLGTSNSDGIGVYGNGGRNGVRGQYGTTDPTFELEGVGVYGITDSSSGSGVVGIGYTGVTGSNESFGPSFSIESGVSGVGRKFGTFGMSLEDGGTGLFGWGSTSFTGLGPIGVLGDSNMAANFIGTVSVVGDLQVVGGNKMFIIDHPIDPSNKFLCHSSVESSETKNIYDGIALLNSDGDGNVTLPNWFEALNTKFRYQLTSVGISSPGLYIKREIQNNRFTIGGGKPHQKVSWQVTGIRHDPAAKAAPLIVEKKKKSNEVSRYVNPEAYHQPKEKRIQWIKGLDMEDMKKKLEKRMDKVRLNVKKGKI